MNRIPCIIAKQIKWESHQGRAKIETINVEKKATYEDTTSTGNAILGLRINQFPIIRTQNNEIKNHSISFAVISLPITIPATLP